MDASVIGKEFTLKNLQPIFENHRKKIETNRTFNIVPALSFPKERKKIENEESSNETLKPSRQWKIRR